MKALLCRAPGDLILTDLPDPGAPGPGWVRLRVTHVGICGTDYHIWQGRHPYLTYPRVMGHEIAATVEAGGDGTTLPPGTPVIVNPYLACGTCIACRAGRPNCCTGLQVLGVHRDGAMCETILMPEGNLIPAGDLPGHAAAAVEFLAIGAHAVARARAAAGRAVVVGAGPIGLATALFATRAGQSVTVMDTAPARRAFAAEIGLTVIDPAGDAGTTALAATGGEGFDIVYDATGNAAAMSGAWALAAHGATLVYVGLVRDVLTLPDPEIHKRELTILTSRNALSSDFATVIAAMTEGAVPIDRIVTHRMDMETAAGRLPQLATSPGNLVKAVITC